MRRAQEPISISGAGPAGLAAALTVAAAGGRAVVYERHGEVGGRFHGDFQGIENWTTRGDVLEELAGIGIQPEFDHTPYREGTFFDPSGRERRYASPDPLFYLVRRGPQPGTLDSSLKEQALAAAVEIRFGEGRSTLGDGGIVAEGPRGADAIAVGYVFDTDMPDGAFGALSEKLAPKGYSYLLLHQGRGTVASCLFDDYHQEKVYLERTVEFFHRKAGLRMEKPRRFGGAGNFLYPGTARRSRILFAGEAAGFQDALWGFGMRYAMLSGHLAARALLEGSPERYDRFWKRRLGGLIRTSMVNRYFYERLGDRGYTSFMRRLGASQDARVWLRRHYRPSFWKTLWFPIARRAVRSSRKDAACIREGCDCTWCRCQRAAATPAREGVRQEPELPSTETA